MLYILCVEVLACKVRSSPDIEGFLLPRASGVHLRFSQYADDITNFVKPIPSLLALFETIALYEKGTGARLNLTRKLARMNGLALCELKGRKFLGSALVYQENWEPRLSKLDKSLCLWNAQLLSFIFRVLILNVLGLSKLLFVSRILEPPNWCSLNLLILYGPFCGALELKLLLTSP